MDLRNGTFNLDARTLSVLIIASPSSLLDTSTFPETFRDAIHFYSAWSTPALSFIITRNLIPIPFSGSNCLKTFILNLDFSHAGGEHIFAITALSLFLSSCPMLERFRLAVIDLQEPPGCRAPVAQ